MKIRLHSTQDVRDVSADVGDMMVSAGLATALTPKEANDYTIATSKPGPHFLNWSARDGECIDGMQYAPALCFRCSVCSLITYAHPMDKPAEPTTFHFEKYHCPDEVYGTYLRLFNAWKSKDKRRHLKGPYQRNLEAYAKRTNDSIDRDELARIKAGEAVAL